MEGPEEEEEKVKERISASAPSSVSCQISHPAGDNNLYEVETCGTASFVDYFLITRINSASLWQHFVLYCSLLTAIFPTRITITCSNIAKIKEHLSVVLFPSTMHMFFFQAQ